MTNILSKHCASRSLIFFILICCCNVPLAAQNNLQEVELDSIGIIYKKRTTPIKGTIQQIQWSTQSLKALPKILGNANPLRLMQSLPGIQTNSEYDGGIHIQGCETGHNLISIAGVPVYNATHLLGIFSTFNSTHFQSLLIEKNLLTTSANRLGGNVEMQLQSKTVDRAEGELTVGPISSQGTLRCPLGKKSTLVVSARGSYLNLLYKKWLSNDESQLKYGFEDYNLTYLFQPTSKDKIWLDTYYGSDNAKQCSDQNSIIFKIKWHNVLGALHWEHLFPKSRLLQTFYTTYYSNKLKCQISEDSYHLPSAIHDYGYKAIWESLHIKAGAQFVYHDIQPQQPQLPPNKLTQQQQQIDTQKTQEYTIFGNYTHPFCANFSASTGLNSTLYIDHQHHTHEHFAPNINLSYHPHKDHRIQFNYIWQHQYLFQTGFSNLGFPTEYWFSSSNKVKPQKAHSFTLSYDINLFGGEWNISAALYYKRLQRQAEYIGNFLEVLEEGYQMEDNIGTGKGTNYGINLLINKCTGKWSGWISYSFGRAFRTFNHPLLTKRYPSNHERIHEFNILGTYRPSPRWELSSTFVAASGTPFTAPEHIYWCNGHIITQFGEHNANRLGPYLRLDLSANYVLKKTKAKEHGLNISLYNATGFSNPIFYRMKFHKNRYAYKPLSFAVKILPSINYYYKF